MDKTPKKPEKKIVWVKCRARLQCEGNNSVVVFSKKKPGGGSDNRYRCLTCKGVFHIAT